VSARYNSVLPRDNRLALGQAVESTDRMILHIGEVCR